MIYKMRNIFIQNKSNKKGFSLIEIIIYTTLLSLVSILVISNIITLFKNYNLVKLNQEIEYNAISILNKLHNNISNSDNIVLDKSSFGVNEGFLSISKASTTNNGVNDVYKFYIENDYMKYMINDLYIGNLTNKYVKISEFKIFNILNSNKGAVKIEFVLENKSNRVNDIKISKKFYTTIQLR